jgi:pimeloyl-ACP methyl ester carboxylesterase
MTTTKKPEIGQNVQANGIRTNFLEAGSGDETVMLIQESGPGVTAYVNWGQVIPALAEHWRVIAPDMVGFGFSDRADDVDCSLQTWADQTVGRDGRPRRPEGAPGRNSFGGVIALRIATQHPDRVGKLVLMGSMGSRS